MDAKPGSPEEDELLILSLLIEYYEKEPFPIDLPDPISAILIRMENDSLTRKEMEQFLGSRSTVSKVLSRKKPLTLKMMRALNKGLEIPMEVLIQETGPIVSDYQKAMQSLAAMVEAARVEAESETASDARELSEPDSSNTSSSNIKEDKKE